MIEIESPKKSKPSVKKKPPKKWSVKKQTLPTTPKPLSSGYKTPSHSGGIIPQGLTPTAKKALKDLGWKEGADSPKGGGKGKKKIRKTKVEKLKEGLWEMWQKTNGNGLGLNKNSMGEGWTFKNY